MYRVVAITAAEDLSCFPSAGVLSEFDAGCIERDRPDVHMLVVDKHDTPLARCSLWWSQTPSYGCGKSGVIGHYAATGKIVSNALLGAACQRLEEAGCNLAIGPMNGNTWRRYRFVTHQGDEPPFFMEPSNPEAWPQYWTDLGFEPLANYTSALNPEPGREAFVMQRVAARYAAAGIRIRALNLSAYEQELESIYRISSSAFVNNFLYTPIPKADFIALYTQIKPFVRPELTLIAEGENGPVGFLFAVPDILQGQRGSTIDTVIFKTVAVVPSWGNRGLGSFLAAKGHALAWQLGYRRTIHALMYEKNISQNISRHYPGTRIIRRYALFAKPLRGMP